MGLWSKPLLPYARPGLATSGGHRGAHAGPQQPGTRGPRRHSRTKRIHLRATTLHTWRQQQPIDNNIGQTPAQAAAIGDSNASIKGHNPDLKPCYGRRGGCSARPRATSRHRRLRSFLALDGRLHNRPIRRRGAGAPRARRSSFRGARAPPPTTTRSAARDRRVPGPRGLAGNSEISRSPVAVNTSAYNGSALRAYVLKLSAAQACDGFLSFAGGSAAVAIWQDLRAHLLQSIHARPRDRHANAVVTRPWHTLRLR